MAIMMVSAKHDWTILSDVTHTVVITYKKLNCLMACCSGLPA